MAMARHPERRRNVHRRTHRTSSSRISAGSEIFRDGTVQSPSLILLVVLATIGCLLYAAFLLNPANVGDPLPYTIVVVCESFLILQILLSLWTALSSTHNPRGFAYHAARASLFTGDPENPDVQVHDVRVGIDVLIPTYGESLVVLERTVRACVALRGAHRTWVLDDMRRPEVAELAARLGAGYRTREGNEGAKAGNINAALQQLDGGYFAIFDADFVPEPNFLEETMPFFADDRVAFVQTPQVYGNIDGFIARASAYMQTVFYALAQPGKNRFNSAFCVGTNVVFRRAAVDSIGGLHAASKSEDIWTSILLHEAGWSSVYIPLHLATGETPDRIESFSKQQVRWATGAFEILLTHNPLSPRRTLTMDQRLQYFATATFYFNGVIPLALLLLPPLQIFLDITPMSMGVPLGQWILFYCGFYVMQVVMAFFTIGAFRWETLLLSSVSFPIYTKALFNAVTGRAGTWHVTGAGARTSPFLYIRVQSLFFLFLLATTLVGVWKFDWTGQLSVALFWNVVNTVALGGLIIVAFREQQQDRRRARNRRQLQTAPRRRTFDPLEVVS
jgi:cellulose synthase (UDP-forming)